MKYLATITYGRSSNSMTFNTMAAAEQWLDERNNNLEHTTIIDEYDDDGHFIDGFFYTKGYE